MVQRDLNVVDLGRMAYADAAECQREVHRDVVSGAVSPTLILVEHEPVITLSRRAAVAEHLRASPTVLRRMGIQLAETDRGGDITYHGPGQLVGYPILPLPLLGLNVGRYMRWLERVVIDALRVLGVCALRQRGHTGIWMREREESLPAKVCALGVRVERNVTLHGFALNVSTCLDHFATIVPCGLHDRSVTSLSRCMGEEAPTLAAMQSIVIETFRHHFCQRVSRCVV